jgi:hypothetical protein
MRFLQILFILAQLPVAIVSRCKGQTAYLLYLMGWDATGSNHEVKHRHYHPQTYSSYTEIDEDIQHSEYLLA